MPEPALSIIVPVYKVEPYLCKCVDSILSQTFRDFELILVDDGSPDKCGGICDGYALNDSRVRVIHQQNSGLSAARNAGLDIARGDYTGFVDSDDWIDASMYENMIGRALEQDADVVICSYFEVIGNRAIVPKSRIRSQVFMPDECVRLILTDEIRNYAWNKIFRRSLFESCRFVTGRAYEDMPLIYRLVGKAKRISYTDVPYYYYQQRYNSIVNSPDPRNIYDSFIFLREREIFARNYHPQLSDKCNEMTAKAALTAYNLQITSKKNRLTDEELADIISYIADNKTRIDRNRIIRTRHKYLFRTLFSCPVFNVIHAKLSYFRRYLTGKFRQLMIW